MGNIKKCNTKAEELALLCCAMRLFKGCLVSPVVDKIPAIEKQNLHKTRLKTCAILNMFDFIITLR